MEKDPAANSGSREMEIGSAFWLYYFFWASFWAICSAVIGDKKGQETSGVIWGLLLGPIGVLIVLMLPDLKKQEEEEAAAAEAETQARRQRQLKKAGRICPACSAEQPGGNSKFCVGCGALMKPGECGECGVSLAAGAKFCGGCGAPASKAKVAEPTATAATPPASTEEAKSRSLSAQMPPPGKTRLDK